MRQRCSVSGCRSSRYASKKENRQEDRHLFAARTMELLELWRNAIPGGSNLDKDDVICDLHFEKEDVMTDFVTKMPDGSECRMKRDRVHLRKGAVPKIFPKSIVKEETKWVLPVVPSYLDENFIKESDFENIFRNVHNIPLPSYHWFMQTLPNKLILWNFWCKDVKFSSKRILLNPDKSVNIYMREKQVNLEDFQKLEDVQDILKLLYTVDELDPCQSDSEKAIDCIGYLTKVEKGTPGRKVKFCPACNKFIRNASQARHRSQSKVDHEKKLRGINNKLREKLKVARKSQKRLVTKVQLLRTKINNLQIKRKQIKKKRLWMQQLVK